MQQDGNSLRNMQNVGKHSSVYNRAVGLTVLSLEVANPANPEIRQAVDFLVDSGAIYSFVPRDVLVRLGIVPHSQQRFRLADGSSIE